MPIPDFQTHLLSLRRKKPCPTSLFNNGLLFLALFVFLTIAGCATSKKNTLATEPKPEAVAAGKNPAALALLAEIFEEDPATAFSHADPLDRRHSLGQ